MDADVLDVLVLVDINRALAFVDVVYGRGRFLGFPGGAVRVELHLGYFVIVGRVILKNIKSESLFR